jgi:hypothetical protein
VTVLIKKLYSNGLTVLIGSWNHITSVLRALLCCFQKEGTGESHVQSWPAGEGMSEGCRAVNGQWEMFYKYWPGTIPMGGYVCKHIAEKQWHTHIKPAQNNTRAVLKARASRCSTYKHSAGISVIIDFKSKFKF